jgi:hypothetical protein
MKIGLGLKTLKGILHTFCDNLLMYENKWALIFWVFS